MKRNLIAVEGKIVKERSKPGLRKSRSLWVIRYFIGTARTCTELSASVLVNNLNANLKQ